MDAQTLNLWPAAPEIFMLTMVCVILVVDLFLDDARRHVSLVLTLLTLFVTAVLAADPTSKLVLSFKVARGSTAGGATTGFAFNSPAQTMPVSVSRSRASSGSDPVV